jgi:hypothetical protein
MRFIPVNFGFSESAIGQCYNKSIGWAKHRAAYPMDLAETSKKKPM